MKNGLPEISEMVWREMYGYGTILSIDEQAFKYEVKWQEEQANIKGQTKYDLSEILPLIYNVRKRGGLGIPGQVGLDENGLLPCALCGCKAVLRENVDNWIYCSDTVECGMEVNQGPAAPDFDLLSYTKACWNKRAGVQP